MSKIRIWASLIRMRGSQSGPDKNMEYSIENRGRQLGSHSKMIRILKSLSRIGGVS